MCPFRRVAGEQAGPTALGVLVPPSRRTVLIVRPRTLNWDLVLAEPSGPLRELQRAEAETLALHLADVLETGDAAARLDSVYSLDQNASWLRVLLGTFTLTVCARQPGQPYRPQLFAEPAAKRSAIESLSALLNPPHEQELYVNISHFTRSV